MGTTWCINHFPFFEPSAGFIRLLVYFSKSVTCPKNSSRGPWEPWKRGCCQQSRAHSAGPRSTTSDEHPQEAGPVCSPEGLLTTAWRIERGLRRERHCQVQKQPWYPHRSVFTRESKISLRTTEPQSRSRFASFGVVHGVWPLRERKRIFAVAPLFSSTIPIAIENKEAFPDQNEKWIRELEVFVSIDN